MRALHLVASTATVRVAIGRETETVLQKAVKGRLVLQKVLRKVVGTLLQLQAVGFPKRMSLETDRNTRTRKAQNPGMILLPETSRLLKRTTIVQHVRRRTTTERLGLQKGPKIGPGKIGRKGPVVGIMVQGGKSIKSTKDPDPVKAKVEHVAVTEVGLMKENVLRVMKDVVDHAAGKVIAATDTLDLRESRTEKIVIRHEKMITYITGTTGMADRPEIVPTHGAKANTILESHSSWRPLRKGVSPLFSFPDNWALPTEREFRRYFDKVDILPMLGKPQAFGMFDGQIANYPGWQEHFYRVVHVQAVPLIHKVSAIDQAVKAEIKNKYFKDLTSSAADYLLRIRRLEEKFGGPGKHMSTMVQRIKAVSEVGKDYGKVQDAIFALERFLESRYCKDPNDPLTAEMIRPYMKEEVRQQYRGYIHDHRLKDTAVSHFEISKENVGNKRRRSKA